MTAEEILHDAPDAEETLGQADIGNSYIRFKEVGNRDLDRVRASLIELVEARRRGEGIRQA
jgi:hypothetical protein